MSGTEEVDRLVFAGALDKDEVTDVQGKDAIQLDGAAQFPDFAGVLARSAQVGADVAITLDGANIVTLSGVGLRSLQANDFLFA